MSNPSCTDEEIVVAAKAAYCHNFIKNLPNVSFLINMYLLYLCTIFFSGLKQFLILSSLQFGAHQH